MEREKVLITGGAGFLGINLIRHLMARGYGISSLDVEEFDQRITATLAARTYGELATLTEDLPEPAPAAPLAALAEDSGDFRSGVAAWAAASVTTMAIWAISCIASGGLIYPWFFWVAGPWGVVLLVTWLGMRLQGR